MYIIPNTKGVHPNLSLAVVNSNISPYGKGELRLFFWDKSGTKIRYAWYDKNEWSSAYPEKGWDVPIGAGKGMDAIAWFDPLDGVHWSCFYCDAQGNLFELSCVSGSKSWTCKEVAAITADTDIRAFVKWDQGKLGKGHKLFILIIFLKYSDSWVKEIWYRSERDDLRSCFTRLRWKAFAGWSAETFVYPVNDTPTHLPFGGTETDTQEFCGVTLDNRIVKFNPARPGDMTYLPIMVASPSSAMRSVVVKWKGKTVKFVFFFMSLEGAKMHEKLAVTVWSEDFPTWVGPMLLPRQ